MFKEKSFNAKIVHYLNKSDKVYILKEEKDWLYILFDDRIGWIPKYAIQGKL